MFPPFLKRSRWPRLAKPMEEKSYRLSYADKMYDHLSGEMMESVGNKDVKRFRSALEALVLNLFEDQEHAVDAGQE